MVLPGPTGQPCSAQGVHEPADCVIGSSKLPVLDRPVYQHIPTPSHLHIGTLQRN